MTVEFDAKGPIVALEVLDAGKRMTPEELPNMSYENLLLMASP